MGKDIQSRLISTRKVQQSGIGASIPKGQGPCVQVLWLRNGEQDCIMIRQDVHPKFVSVRPWNNF